MTEQENILHRKRLRIDNLLSSLKDETPEEEDSSDNEINKYKSLTSGKLNLKSISKDDQHWTPDMYKKTNGVEKTSAKKDRVASEAGKLLDLLPIPKRKLMDNTFSIGKPKVKVFV
jgi:hypothetical protein